MQKTLPQLRDSICLAERWKPVLFFLSVFFATQGTVFSQVNLQVTEIFAGQAGTDLTEDWFEIKNMDTVAWIAGVDPGLFYDDDSSDPTAADSIMGISEILPGGTAIVLISGTASDTSIFSGVWGPVIDLTGVQIGYTDGSGLSGNGDAVTLWIGDPMTTTAVDTAAYPITTANDGQTFDVELGVFSVVGNANNAVETIALGGTAGNVPNIGSPGNGNSVMQNPNAPVLTGDSANASPYLNISIQNASAVSSDLTDPTDPAVMFGIPLDLVDTDSPLDSITLTVSSSNQAVVPDMNLTLSGMGADRMLDLIPAGIGYSTITVTATDPDGNMGSYAINYAVSDATIDPTTTRFHVGSSDGSTALSIDGDFMWVADDENQTIRLYSKTQSGMPIYSMDFNAALGTTNEVDIEGSLRNADTLFWMGSHTEPDRAVIFSTVESGTGASATLSYIGKYTDLQDDLIAWDSGNIHGLGADYFGFAAGFEIEALSADPNNPDGALLGFRSPVINGKALVIPVNNFQSIVSATPVPNSAVFGTPIELDLEGHSVRSLECNSNGCLMIAGPHGTIPDFRLFTWTGNASDTPELRAADLSAQTNLSSFEGIVDLPTGLFLGSDGDADTVQLLVDTGTFDYYNDGNEAKDLPNGEWKKFRSELVLLDTVQIPPIANLGDVVITEIMQNPSAVTDGVGEWFELYNATAASIDISGWIISDNDFDVHVIDTAAALVIPAGAYVVLGVEGDSALNGGVLLDYSYASTPIFLSNGADELVLTTPDSVEVDRVEWDGGPLFPDPNGASMSLQATNLDNNDGANWCEAMTATYGAGDFGTPGAANDCIAPPSFDLQITEMWSGQDGADLTADWFEITNFGTLPWVSGVDETLFYDDESQDPIVADTIHGIVDIQPGESVVIVIDNATAVPVFSTVWSPDYDLSGIEIGWTDGSGLGQTGDGVTLFVGPPSISTIVDFEQYPAPPSGVSYDIVLGAFSQVGQGMAQLGTNIAAATTATAGTTGNEPAIGSPGNQGPLGVAMVDLQITEMFPGQIGDDLTEDWFEITNNGSIAWVSGVDPVLFYDDDSSDPAVADSIFGINQILPGASAVVLITGTPADTTTFIDIWSPVIDLTGVEIGYTDGSGLGGGGDAVTLWMGDPLMNAAIDTAVYPDPAPFDGQSYDSDLDTFSVVGNANGAVATVALGGDSMTVANIGSPGNGLAIPPSLGLEITEMFPGQSGDDLTADWFEITNIGTDPWISGVDPVLFYDDDSADPTVADSIMGISQILPGATAIVLITGTAADTTTFIDVWSPVIDLTGVDIGYTDGSGLGGGGDGVTLWLGDPSLTAPIDTASYPDTDLFDGQSYDSDLDTFSVVGNANGAVATIALGGDSMTVANIGSPGNGLAVPQASGLEITEMFPGQAGDDLTTDWFEITNTGTEAWVSGVDPVLFYDDDSADPTVADSIMGISQILPGATAIVLLTGTPADTMTFIDVWSPVIDLTGVEIGYTDGSGLGGGGDGVTLWLGGPTGFLPIDTASYPDTDLFDGQSYDSDLGEFSVVGNANGAVATIALGGDSMTVANIGSPGNGLAIPEASGLEITEIFPGQAGDDLTEDWFEIKNTDSVAWVSGVDPDLYYDDVSADSADAVLIQGITDILPGETVLVVVTSDPADTITFKDVWSPVIDLTGIEIGFADGSGLGGGGDAVTLWLDDPQRFLPIDTASYPDTDMFDGQSYDSELGEFSIVGNANGAVATIALSGDNMDVPNIGSPGNGLAVPQISGLEITEIFSGQAGVTLTEDWFEIKNTDSVAWISGIDPDLYYDDESADSAEAVLIQGITDILPDETVLVVLTSDPADTTTFKDVWSPVIDLTGIEIGFADGSGLGGGGDAVTLWAGDPARFLPVDTASYPDTDMFDGQSYDSELGEFSVDGNANGAVTTLALGGDNMDIPNVGSPGNGLRIVGIESHLDAFIDVYPNPTHGTISIQATESDLIETIKISDLEGRLILHESVQFGTSFTYDLSSQADGIYLLQILSKEGMMTKRIVKR